MLNKEKLLIYIKPIIYLFWIFPIRNNRILCWSFIGNDYGDSPKYIAELLKEKHKNSIEIIWVISKKQMSIPSGIKPVKKYSIKYFYYIATSKIWIFNTRTPIYFAKRKKQIYIQTWHSALRLKKIEADAIEYLSKEYIKTAKHDAKITDIILCGNNFSKNIFRKSFFYNGKIEMTGTPRLDVLKDENYIANVKKRIKTLYNCGNKIIILYAPTFRSFSNDDDWTIDLQKLQKELGENYIIIARAHPKTKINISTPIIDATDYDDIQDLIISSDILITDYSSCCFDALYANKKCILHIPDEEQYLKNERSLYFKPSDLPFIKTTNMQELVEAITTRKTKAYDKKIKEFLNRIGDKENFDGTKKTVDLIEQFLSNEK